MEGWTEGGLREREGKNSGLEEGPRAVLDQRLKARVRGNLSMPASSLPPPLPSSPEEGGPLQSEPGSAQRPPKLNGWRTRRSMPGLAAPHPPSSPLSALLGSVRVPPPPSLMSTHPRLTCRSRLTFRQLQNLQLIRATGLRPTVMTFSGQTGLFLPANTRTPKGNSSN